VKGFGLTLRVLLVLLNYRGILLIGRLIIEISFILGQQEGSPLYLDLCKKTSAHLETQLTTNVHGPLRSQ
jgi:hypothetical protein